MKMLVPFLSGLLLTFALIAILPIPKDMRYDALGLDAIRLKAVHERIVANPKPIDVAFIGQSNIWTGVADSTLESLLTGNGDAVAVANLGTIWPGRDLNLFYVRQLLQYKKPRLIILDIGDHEYAAGHPALPYVAGLSDMFCCRFFIDPHFPKNFSKFLTRQALNGLQIAEHGWSARPLPAPVDFGWKALDRVWKAPAGYSLDTAAFTTRYKEAGYVAISSYGLGVVRQIVELARSQGVDVAFLHLPVYIYAGRPPVVPLPDYTRLAPVLRIPEVLARDPTLWADPAHLNARGAELLTTKLFTDISMLLHHEQPADVWK
jgi:hypothetical protein